METQTKEVQLRNTVLISNVILLSYAYAKSSQVTDYAIKWVCIIVSVI